MRNIYIVGYMASGKTTIGKRLAEDLCLDFIDTDDFIEGKMGKTIAEIFIQEGEEYFRNQERNIISVLSATSDTVVATGGGLPCHSDNMQFLNSVGETVFIDTPVEEILSRLRQERETRPLVKDLDKKVLPYFVKENYAKRLPIYKEARHTISSEEDYEKLKDYFLRLY